MFTLLEKEGSAPVHTASASAPAPWPISNTRPLCAFPHIEYSTRHAIVSKQIGCIGHPTPKGTSHAHHRRSETPRHLTRLPRRHFWPRAARRIRAYPPKLVATSA